MDNLKNFIGNMTKNGGQKDSDRYTITNASRIRNDSISSISSNSSTTSTRSNISNTSSLGPDSKRKDNDAYFYIMWRS